MLDCADIQQLAVPAHVMTHVVKVESGYNPYAIGVVGGRLQRQPRNLPEAVATARMLEQLDYNFSLGIAQVNRFNLKRYGLSSYTKAFDTCLNLKAGSRILRECYDRAGDWGKAFSCYYSGNFTTGFRHGYVQKVMSSMQLAQAGNGDATPIAVIPNTAPARAVARRASPASATPPASAASAPTAAASSAPSSTATPADRRANDAAFVF
ncbi:MAG: lytic transglycosylase domain-containing protein [Pseudomonadota bacterium]|nr:lytic transglycosylase domain-containing protein [Pseudomonadota bacterium]